MYLVGRILERNGYLCSIVLLKRTFFGLLLCAWSTDAGVGVGDDICDFSPSKVLHMVE